MKTMYAFQKNSSKNEKYGKTLVFTKLNTFSIDIKFIRFFSMSETAILLFIS